MEHTTALVLPLERPGFEIRLLYWGIDELKELEADTISRREKCDFDLLKFVAVDLERYIVGPFFTICCCAAVDTSKAKVLAVPFCCFLDVWNGDANVVEDVVLIAMRMLNRVSVGSMLADGECELTCTILTPSER